MEEQLLPKEAYVDEAFFQLEQAHIFSKHWQFVGLVEDIKMPGDYLCVQAGLTHLIVLMNATGELVAFHNMCRHRGAKLLDGKGKLSNRLVCPYHDWTYDLKGNLLSLPKHKQEFPDFDKSCSGLISAKVGVWRGMIWVHPDKDALDLADWFAPMENHLAPYDVESLIESTDDRQEEIINANWKIVVENYIDHYHLAHLHAGTLNMYDHKRAVFGFEGNHFRFWEPQVAEYLDNIEHYSPLPLIMDSKDKWLGAWVPMLFPGIGLAESESTWSVFHIIPVAVDRTKVVIRTKVKNCSMVEYAKQSAKSYGYWRGKVKAKNAKLNDSHPLGSADFMQEDIYVCEQLQQSISSPYFSFGPSAALGEAPVRQHQQIVWRLLKNYCE